jgi:hypothetical protein
MFGNAWWDVPPTSSFNQPIPPVSADPTDDPQVPFKLNQSYIPYLLAMMEQGMLQGAYGDISEDDLNLVQARWMTARSIVASASIENIRPFYQDGSEVESDENTSGQLWYEPVGDWIISAFLATTVTPLAAIVYNVFIPKLRLTLRAHDLGATFKVLLNGLEVLTGDSYSPITKLVDFVIDVQKFGIDHALGNPPYQMKVQMVAPSGARLVRALRTSDTLPSLQVCLGDIRLPSDVSSSSGADSELMIRQDPDNPCLLQSSVDGTNWCTFADLSKCLNSSTIGQIGAGAPQPSSGGGQACYHATMPANNTFLVPTVVNSGDVLSLNNATGATNDPDDSPLWRCPDGSQFFAGACVGYPVTVSTDPIPSANHLRLIYNVGGAYYDAIAGTFTVPSGVSNAQVSVQVNDSNLSNDSGSLTFDVCVTNNQVVTYTHTFDFTLNPGPFTPYVGGGITYGVWTSGIGWQAEKLDGNTQVSLIEQISATLKGISFTLNVTQSLGGTNHADIQQGNFGASLYSHALSTGIQTPAWSDSPFADVFTISAFNQGEPSGQLTITSCTVIGQGVDPF